MRLKDLDNASIAVEVRIGDRLASLRGMAEFDDQLQRLVVNLADAAGLTIILDEQAWTGTILRVTRPDATIGYHVSCDCSPYDAP